MLAKTAGVSLQDHARHVREEAESLLRLFPFFATKYHAFFHGSLHGLLDQAARYHDAGKSLKPWQAACQRDYDFFLKWCDTQSIAISPEAYRRFEKSNAPRGQGIRTAGFRHEIGSLIWLKHHFHEKEWPLEVLVAIAAHHGKLSYRHKHRWVKGAGNNPDAMKLGEKAYKSVEDYWYEMERRSYEIRRGNWSFADVIRLRYKLDAVRSLLQLSDTRASGKEGEGGEEVYKLAPFELKDEARYPGPLRPVQLKALKAAKRGIAPIILRASTGSGKSYAALIWAEEHIKSKRADRLIIAMPTRFTSNALSMDMSTMIAETGLYHSSAWFNRYKGSGQRDQDKDAAEAHRMAKHLMTPLTVCTIDHLLLCLSGAREHHHVSFMGLANSAVAIDEVDFYDPYIQANIRILIEALKILKVPVLIMSATVPDSARATYDIASPILEDTEPVVKSDKRLVWIGKDDQQKSVIIQKMLTTGTGIIYANTVARAINYYKELKPLCRDSHTPIALYHSVFTEPDKKRKEDEVLKYLGKEAWQKGTARGIVIMTQIGEMSVNISAPNMLSDLCPWDRLAQRIGRLGRFNEQNAGVCYVIEPIEKDTLYPAPYAEYHKNGKPSPWEPYPAMRSTMDLLIKEFSSIRAITSANLVQYVNQLYPEASELSPTIQANVDHYLDLIRSSTIILPNMKENEEESSVGALWSTRKIPAQAVVLTKVIDRVSSYKELQEFQLQYGVTVPVYKIEQELRNDENGHLFTHPLVIGKADEDAIRPNKEEVRYIAHEGVYSYEMGLSALYTIE